MGVREGSELPLVLCGDSCPGSCRGRRVGSLEMSSPRASPQAWPRPQSATRELSPQSLSRPGSRTLPSAGYGQDLAGFGQGFSDPSQQPPSYGGPSVPGSGGPPAGGSGFGRGQNHNVQGFHPYRR